MTHNYKQFFDLLKTTALKDFAKAAEPLVDSYFEGLNHGDFQRWIDAIEAMGDIEPSEIDLDSPYVRIGSAGDISDQQLAILEENLRVLHPWRKGPYEVFGLPIETEWRSDLKWDRLIDKIAPLAGRLVLDIGCSNGYHCFRMAAKDAAAVVGIEPFLLYVTQFHALNRYIRSENVSVLPLGIEQMPDGIAAFDSVFSMGVIYHRKDPAEHLAKIMGLLAPGGQMILETLVIDTPGSELLVPEKRYAKMRNVWNIPSPTLLTEWVQAAGFEDAEVIDVTVTTTAEQRPTDWMTFESLPDFLDPADETKTIEGHPAPVRAVIVATKPIQKL